MALITYVKCDVCGKEEQGMGLPKGWVKISVSVSIGGRRGDTSKSVDVCSFKCGREFFQSIEEAQKDFAEEIDL
mgnify:FL=1